MSSINPAAPAPAGGDTKSIHDKKDGPIDENRIEHVDTGGDNVFEKFPRMDKVDEFGAHSKTDPAEIALVKKLDRYIIVCCNVTRNTPAETDSTFSTNSPFFGSCTCERHTEKTLLQNSH